MRGSRARRVKNARPKVHDREREHLLEIYLGPKAFDKPKKEVVSDSVQLKLQEKAEAKRERRRERNRELNRTR